MTRRLAVLVALAVALVAPAAWGCEGPGAEAVIERAERLGWILLAVSAVVGLLSPWLATKRYGVSPSSLWLGMAVLSHPGWWMTARGGDCGHTRVLTSWVATALTVLLAVVVFLRARRASR